MAKVEIYTTMFCPYCHRAKQLLTKKGVQFHEIDVSSSPELRAEMRERADGRSTVPQIFINGRGVGGSDDLQVLEDEGKLDRLLSAA